MGTRVGAIRYCEFTTGAFVEPITAWEEGRLLAFSVRSQPDPMIEVSPYGALRPPHLDTAIRSEKGEFLITPMADGSVELTGTTWYRSSILPSLYWDPMTDYLIHRIHSRVLNHIRDTVESGTTARLP